LSLNKTRRQKKRNKERRKEGRKERLKEGRKDGRRERGRERERKEEWSKHGNDTVKTSSHFSVAESFGDVWNSMLTQNIYSVKFCHRHLEILGFPLSFPDIPKIIIRITYNGHARQVPYHLSYAHCPIFIFETESCYFYPVWSQTLDSPASVSQVAGITSMSHQLD
jgi:hypothetical protein